MVDIVPVIRGGVTGGVVGNVASPSAESHILSAISTANDFLCPKATPSIGDLDCPY